jgi:DNA mismatch repair protein MSH3
MERMDQHTARLTILTNEAWNRFLESFVAQYDRFRVVVQRLAMLDCLYSLASVAKQPGYVRPEVLDETSTPTQVVVEGGRHPMVDQLMMGEFVANDTALSREAQHCMVITGPNMGGKSSYIRQVDFSSSKKL